MFRNILAKKAILSTAIFVMLFSVTMVFSQMILVQSVSAAASTTDLNVWGSGSNADVDRVALSGSTGLGETDPRTIAAKVINVALGFLGIIAVVLILAGGFKWMTAQGNDEAVASAKSLMVAGVVGLIIVLAAFGIARFVVDALVDATKTVG